MKTETDQYVFILPVGSLKLDSKKKFKTSLICSATVTVIKSSNMNALMGEKKTRVCVVMGE